MNILTKICCLFISLILCNNLFYAEVPQKFSYQAVIRDEQGNLIDNRTIAVQISVLQDEQTVYQETHNLQTNTNGLLSLQIGSGMVVLGDFSAIDWSVGDYFVKTEIDLNNGTNYMLSSITELLSVPYALHAETAENTNEVDPVFSASLASSITEADTQNWSNKQNILYAGEGITITNDTIQANLFSFSISDSIREYTNPLNSEIEYLKSEIEELKQSLQNLQQDLQIATGTLVKDIDGNIYKTMKYGNQTWMIENLRVTRYNDGTPIAYVQDNVEWSNQITDLGNDYTAPPMYCFRDTSIEGIIKYGALYNWFTVNPANSKQLCPTGWHVPSQEESNTLMRALIAEGYNYDNNVSTNKLAKAMTMGDEWGYSNVVGSPGNTDYPEKKNASKFSAIPVGYRHINGTYIGINQHVDWWSITTSYYSGMYTAVYTSISYNEIFFTICTGGTLKPYAKSIRCVKD